MRNLIQSKIWFIGAFVFLLAVMPSFAQDQKASAPLEEDVVIKAPPRSVKDVLSAVARTKLDPEELSKAKAVLASSVPDGSDKEQMHFYYKHRAQANQMIGRNDLAIENMRLATEKYKSKDQRSHLESMVDLGIYETRGGNLKNSIVTFE